ncbi:hypothetical protein DPMN_089351 [Dreissena polymorpha]|uniref:COR domain-containing protein n=1 Tax=Dreissena polymorpha TaxID=45954 RepID=A0A9D4KWS0_DREPO|nr:hypothetical protein DPMN_089351 [Dreissena polymorpha]
MAGNDEDKEIQKDNYFDEAQRSFERSSILHHIHSKKFLVNNVRIEDPVFHDIRREIKLLAEKQDYWCEKYPVKWIQMEQSFDKLRHKGYQLLHMTEIDMENSLLIHPLTEQELALFLDIQHRHGNILYFNTDQLKNLVVLAPEWIIDVFRCFINHKHNKFPHNLEHWSAYENNAILKPEVFNEIMNESPPEIKHNSEHVLQYMEHLDVMAKPLKEEDIEPTDLQHHQQDTVDLAVHLNPHFVDFHIVPCRLKKPPPPIAQFTSPELCKKTPVVCFVFVQNFMPPSFFHRLVAVCIRTWPISRAGRKNLLYNGLAAFDMTETYVLTIWYNDHIIYARITSCTNDMISGLNFEKCQEVRLILRKICLNFQASHRKTHGLLQRSKSTYNVRI